MPSFPALFDPRSALIRPDLAEQALEGLAAAAAYRPLMARHGRLPVCDVFSGPQGDAPRISQLLSGEAFDVLDAAAGRAWGRCRRDGVIGWVAQGHLADGAPVATHRICTAGGELPLNALVGQARPDAVPTGEFADDPAAVAEALIGVRHALGGRSSFETDCAGLVQQALLACGRAGPRYADGQAALGDGVAREAVRRGDLAVWRHPTGGPGWTGHSALMLDETRLIHASGAQGAVVVETVSDVDARLRAEGFDAPLFRRL